MPVVSHKFWIVFFEPGTARVVPKSIEILDGFARRVNELQSAAIVETYTDRIGDEEKNFGMSYRRALALRDALVWRGIATEKIVLTPRGYQAIDPGKKGPDTWNDRADLRISDSAWPSNDPRPWPPKGYVKTTMRCVRTEQLFVSSGVR
jgi:hypothetical protein